MKNTFTHPTDFWQERDFGTKISATFEFIGAHWRPLGKCLLYFVLPGALLMGIGLGLFLNPLFDMSGHAMAAQRAGTTFPLQNASLFKLFNFGGLALAVLSGLVAFLLLSGTLYGYLRARLRHPAGEVITPALVWAALRERLGRMVLALLLSLGVGLVFMFLFLLISAAFTSWGVGGLFFAMLLLTIPATYCSVALSLYFPVLWLEDQGIFASVGRCLQLIRGRWWATLGLLLVAGFIQSTLTLLFALPQYAVMIGKMLQLPGLNSDVLGLAAQCFYAVGLIFTYCVPLLALSFQYFNLVEQKQGFGLSLLVDQLGQPQAAPVAQSGHYRPDEEGEY